MIDLTGGAKKPTELQYEISCTVKVFDVTYEDVQGRDLSYETKQMITEQMVFLFPRASTQTDLFLSAWLPEVADEYVEIGLRMGHPVHGYIRSCLFRSQSKTDAKLVKQTGLLKKFSWREQDNFSLSRPHIFIQTKGAEEILKNLKGSTVVLTVLGEQEEELLDQQRDFTLSTQR